MKVRLLALAFGFFLVAGGAWAGPTPGGTDSDGDTVENAFDNCVSASNASQVDTNHNGCGDTCNPSIQCDVNGDTAVGLPDYGIIGTNFGMTGYPPNTNGDCTGDGAVGLPDYGILGTNFGHVAGPSGITNAQCDSTTCQCTPQ